MDEQFQFQNTLKKILFPYLQKTNQESVIQNVHDIQKRKKQ